MTVPTTMDAAGGKAEAIRERLADAATSARRTCQRLEDGAMDTAKAADRAVREHPYPSIGVAFGIGLLIGVLVTRK